MPRHAVFFWLIMSSCIQPFDVNINNSQESLVVDGLISDQPGPYTVRIAKALALDDELGAHWVQGATVSIFDELGNETRLTEVSPGNYLTDPQFRGVPETTYRLHFITNEGSIYESAREKLLPVGDLDSLYYEYVQGGTKTLSFDPFETANGFSIYVDAKLLPEQEGLMRWRWTATFGIKTYPEFKKSPSTTVPTILLPDPPACSGYAADGMTIRYVGPPCTCCLCWITQYSPKVLTSELKNVTHNVIGHKGIAFIPASRRYLSDKYYLAVEQMSISRVSYDFWNAVEAQQGTQSNLFQTPPPHVVGNIQMISGNLPAMGIFSASSIKKKILTLTSSNVPYAILPIDTIAADCKSVYPYYPTTTKKPPFW